MTHQVKNWEEANDLIQKITGGIYTLGTGYNYPLPYAVLFKDALSGDSRGYYVYSTKTDQLDSLTANIVIGGQSG